MSKGIKKLAHDVLILAEMTGEMDDYLRSDVLFWSMMKGDMPKLTLGGALMRQHRLLALRSLLSGEEQRLLDTAVAQFQQSLTEKVVRFEQKAGRELAARIRQWGEYLKDLQREEGAAANYRSAVETRVMITAVTDKLSQSPYQLDPHNSQQIDLLDGALRRQWQTGPFVWPEAWQPAYPMEAYWWLYGCVQG